MTEYSNATEAAPGAAKSASVWLDRLTAYKSRFEKWYKACENVDKHYSRKDRADTTEREYAIFWANLEVLRPATYARPPAPVVAPRFKDSNPIAREASEALERTLVTTFEQADIDDLLRQVRDEYLRYGRGTAWVRMVNGNAIEYDFVGHKDFAHELKPVWREVTWVARRAWLNRESGVQRFGDAFKKVALKKQDENSAIEKKDDCAPVWEIWCKTSRKVYWVAEDFEQILDEQDPMFDLVGFWPCPKPALATLEPKSLVPVPEIKQYKDQIEEINEYTARIAAVSESLKLRGFYAAGTGDVATAIEVAMKSQDDRALLVPISSFAALGGSSFKDSIVWVPIAEAVALVRELVALRRVVIEDVYQITGISDIVRGQSDPNETMGAQQLKSQWGSMRIRERQAEIARLARDMTRITGEIIAEHFEPETLLEMAQVTLPNAQQKQQAEMLAAQAQQMQQPLPKEVSSILKRPSFEEVVAFLRNDRARGFVIEIETDSTIQPDEDAEKQRRIEFVTSVGGLFQQAAPLVMQAPMLGKFVVEVMKFAAGGFRAGRPLEASLDELGEQIEAMSEQAAQPQEPPPDPAVELKKAEIELKRAESEQKLAFEKQRHAQQMQFDQEKHAQEVILKREDMAARQMEAKTKTEIEGQRHQAEMDFKREQGEADREAHARTMTQNSLDGEGVMQKAADALSQMATDQAQVMADQSQAMAQAVQALTAAVERLGGPRRKTVMGSKGQQYEITDEAI